uniref:Uncharacterized protein n=1 Tax=Glossina austeni TaxID=7395 RepID=A0A1A9V789_GLOAU
MHSGVDLRNLIRGINMGAVLCEFNLIAIAFTYLSQHRRLKTEPLQRRYFWQIAAGNKADLADFVMRKDTTFAGSISGNCLIYEYGYATDQQLHNSKKIFAAFKLFFGGMYATSTDNCCKLWQRTDEFCLLHLDQIMEFNESFQAVQLNTDDGSDDILFNISKKCTKQSLHVILIHDTQSYYVEKSF